MPNLSPELRNQLEKVIIRAREVAESGAHKALVALQVSNPRAYLTSVNGTGSLVARLRNHARQLGDPRDEDGFQAVDRLAHECAYQHWHRMLFARFLAENNLLLEPSSRVPVSLMDCEELAREQGRDLWELAGQFAAAMLPEVFRPEDPALAVMLPPETRQQLERLLGELPETVFTSDDGLSWTYQFWQSAEKKRVNESGEKITGETLPAVTQLFTEPYMVQFLLHNTIGAWYTGKILERQPNLLVEASTEEEARLRLALSGYSFDYLRLLQADQTDGRNLGWWPVAGTFSDWPNFAKDLKVLDPCCGSGHFLVAALPLLVELRRQQEEMDLPAAVHAVLADNLFGLEIDPRCTQIAAFNLALTAWKMVGRVMPLPRLNIACSGVAVRIPKKEWLDAAGSDVGERDDLNVLYELFALAPEIGSLLDPQRAAPTSTVSAGFSGLFERIKQLLQREEGYVAHSDSEWVVVAQGMAKAAELLAGHYHLVITNVPYLHRNKQGRKLRDYLAREYPISSQDLATAFLERCLNFNPSGGTTAIVLPQNWLFLKTYKKFREKLLRTQTWHGVAWLGSGAFHTITGEVVKAALVSISRGRDAETARTHKFAAVDASALRHPGEKAAFLRQGNVNELGQSAQLENPDARVVSKDYSPVSLLSQFASGLAGLQSGDYSRFGRQFWELCEPWQGGWVLQQSTVDQTMSFGGRRFALKWESGNGALANSPSAYIRGLSAWGKSGIAVSQAGKLPATIYTGESFDNNTAVILPHDPEHLAAIWCYVSSPDYCEDVRMIDQKLNVTNATLVKVPFDLPYWQQVAAEWYPNGLPKPYSPDPTQWIFHGHPADSTNPLQVAVARLVGYRWPAELDGTMELSDEARQWVQQCDDLLPHADADGIVCLSPVRGELSAADRLRSLLAAAYGPNWSVQKEQELLGATEASGGTITLEAWLRDRFFEEHCKLFHHRPFVWHIWDGRRDGFHALVNYHRLAGPVGQGRRTLEMLAYTYLGDWIERQRVGIQEGAAGAEARLAAAQDLQEQLRLILEGEAPLDIFVRWKPLHRQPLGWEPDLDDGVRVNIRPFMLARLQTGGRTGAGLLRSKPNIHWRKDRGRETPDNRDRSDYPWFWGCEPDKNIDHRQDYLGGPDFDGIRWNDLHYSRNVKRQARERAKAVESV